MNLNVPRDVASLLIPFYDEKAAKRDCLCDCKDIRTFSAEVEIKMYEKICRRTAESCLHKTLS